MVNIPEIYNDPILFRKRQGNHIDPFREITESVTVESAKVVLNEVPNREDRVKATINGVPLYEVERDEFLQENTFKVNYTHGYIDVHESLAGKTIDFEYTGEGVYLFPDSRVYRTNDPTFPTLRDKIDDIDREILNQKSRVDTLIIKNPQPSEVVDLRIDRNGKIFPVAKDRIDAEQFKIEEAYTDAFGVRHESLKKRIDSLQISTKEKIDELNGYTSELDSQLRLVPGQITAKVSELREYTDGQVKKLTSMIDMVPGQIQLKVEEIRQWANGEFSRMESSINMLPDMIEAKVDVDGVINAINISKEGTRISGNKLKIDADAYIGKAVIEDANIKSVSASKIKAGIIRSENDNAEWNLNTGLFRMNRNNFVLGGGANIEFTDAGNRIIYTQDDPQTKWVHSAGIGVGRNINERFPYVFMGTTRGDGLHAQDSRLFTGFIANTDARMSVDSIGNSVVGDIFHIRDKSVDFSQGFRFDLSGKVKYMRPLNTHRYDYEIGGVDHRFLNVYTENVRSKKSVNIRDASTRSGWLVETRYAGDGRAITFRGLNGGSYNYSIGQRESYNRITSIFLKNKPNVSSDMRLKEDIEELELGLDFVLDLSPVSFKFKKTKADKVENKKEFGFLAQDVERALNKRGISVETHSLVSKDKDGIYAMEHEQLIAPIITSIHELYHYTKKENKKLKERIRILESKLIKEVG